MQRHGRILLLALSRAFWSVRRVGSQCFPCSVAFLCAIPFKAAVASPIPSAPQWQGHVEARAVNRLPYEIREAMVTVLGKVFWLKDPFKAFLLAAGVPREVVDRYAEEPKFKIARH